MSSTRIVEVHKTCRYEEGTHDDIVARYLADGWVPLQGNDSIIQTTLVDRTDPGALISISKVRYP